MAQVDCHKDIQGFHDEEVTLGPTERTEMRNRRNNGRIRLRNGLDKSGHPKPSEIHSQGSYAMRTMVQDPKKDYDIDDGVYFLPANLEEGGKALDPKGARTRVRDALKDDRLAYDAVVRDNCVRQPYPDGYHIDIPVYRIRRGNDAAGNEEDKYDLASGDSWVQSDAREVTKWYEDNAASAQRQYLVRLAKKQARSRQNWKRETISGISITKLVLDHYQAGFPDRDDVALRKTWEAIKAKLDYDQRIAHPIAGLNDLAANGDEKVKFFRDKLGEALETLKALESSSCTQKQARAAWDEVFNCSYFSNLPDGSDDGNSKSGGPFILGGGKTSRNDNEGRFG